VAWECATAPVPDNALQWLRRQGEERMMVFRATALQAAEGEPATLTLGPRGAWHDRRLVETGRSMRTVVSHGTQGMHRVWEYVQARLAGTMAALHVLVQWYGLPPDGQGFVPLSIAAFSV